VSAGGAGDGVLRFAGADQAALGQLLGRYGLSVVGVPAQAPIPGSYWGESEAGLERCTLFVRSDTPLHSLLHEASHFICMSPARRAQLCRDAGGTDLEEAAVCYLQILLAAELAGVGAARLMRDMDAWGYSFRLGSAAAWFAGDAADAHAWLRDEGILDPRGHLSGACRASADPRA
jgi:hypothetical protein